MRQTALLSEPQQKRSQQSLEKLLHASRELISSSSFDEASVQDIVRRADYSVGAFYSRFRNKDALFQVVQVRVLDESKTWLKAKIAEFIRQEEKGGDNPSLNECIDFCIRLNLRLYLRNPGIYRAIFLHTRVKRDPELLSRVKEFNSWALKESLKILKKSKQPSITTALEASWIAGLSIISVHLRELVIFGDPVPTTKGRAFDGMVKTAADMLMAYLTTSIKDK